MNFSEGFFVGLTALRNNKFRSTLTMLGIVIGISSVVGAVSIGSGARVLVLHEFQRVGGATMIQINRRGWIKKGGRWERNSSPNYLRAQDVSVIQANCPTASYVTPEIYGIPINLNYENRDYSTECVATTPDYQISRNWTVEMGRFLTKEDVETSARVCVLGVKAWDELTQKANIIGQEVKGNGVRLRVVGIMKEKGDSMESRGWDKYIFVPLTTAQKRMLGNDHITQIMIQSESFETVDQTVEEIRRVLRWRYKDADEIFGIWTVKDVLKDVEQVSLVLKVLLGGVASIALIVGGIGIMNIMLVSVTERTKEIGLRKALGAKRLDILLQFLIESTLLSLAGGIIGVLFGVFIGVGAAKLVSTFIFRGIQYPSIVSIQSALVAFMVSLIIGLFFGLYPANKAARLTPTEALRVE